MEAPSIVASITRTRPSSTASYVINSRASSGKYKKETSFDLQCQLAQSSIMKDSARPASLPRIQRELAQVKLPAPPEPFFDTRVPKQLHIDIEMQMHRDKETFYSPPPKQRRLSAPERALQALHHDMHDIVATAVVDSDSERSSIVLIHTNAATRRPSAASVVAPHVRPGLVASPLVNSAIAMTTRSFSPPFHRPKADDNNMLRSTVSHMPEKPPAKMRFVATTSRSTGETLHVGAATVNSTIRAKFSTRTFEAGRRLNEFDNEWRKQHNLRPNFVLHTSQREAEENHHRLEAMQEGIVRDWKAGRGRNVKPALQVNSDTDSKIVTIKPVLAASMASTTASDHAAESHGHEEEIIADVDELRSTSLQRYFPTTKTTRAPPLATISPQNTVRALHSPTKTSRALHLGSPTLAKHTSVLRSAAAVIEPSTFRMRNTYEQFITKTIATDTNQVDYGIIQTGISYVYAIMVHNHTPNTRRIRIDCAGWFKEERGAVSSMLCKLEKNSLPPGLSTKCFVFVLAMTPGRLNGMLRLSFDDGKSRTVKLAARAISEEAFQRTLGDMDKASDTAALRAALSEGSISSSRAEFEREFPIDDATVISEVEHAFGNHGGSVDTTDTKRTPWSRPGSSIKHAPPVHLDDADMSRVEFQENPVDVLDRTVALLLTAGTFDSPKGRLRVDIDLDRIHGYVLPYGMTAPLAFPLVVRPCKD